MLISYSISLIPRDLLLAYRILFIFIFNKIEMRSIIMMADNSRRE